jgi:peptide/nickel transport system substrate-binding protein
MPTLSGTSRRHFLHGLTLLGGAALAAACGGAPASPTAAPKAAEPTKPTESKPAAPAAAATTAPAAPAATKPAEAAKPTEAAKPAAPAAGAPTQKPRNRTLILMWSGRQGKYIDHELWNNYAVGANHQNGLGILHEPLAFYSAFADKEHLWLAESYKYSPDFKELTIKTRSGVAWSDGAPFSANDVVYTIEALKRQGSKVKWGVDVERFVDSVSAPDANTVMVKFKVPAPRFFRFLLTYKFDIGATIVPKHVFEKEDDWTKFQYFDLAKGWPLSTGPWKVVFASPDQKVIDRRDDWWAVKAGLATLPAVERIVYLPFADDTVTAQAFITNQIDSSLDLRPNTMKTLLAQAPKVTTHVGREVPYGYVDWWPTSLYVNCSKEPWNDKDVRWAVSYMIDRKQIVEVGYGGAGTVSRLPMPTYKPLMPYFDIVKDLLEKHDTTKFDAAQANKTLADKGWKKDGNTWRDAKGQPVKLEIGGFPIFNDIGPLVVEQLKRQGIDASYVTPPDMGDRFAKGDYTGMLFGHGGSISDPYDTLRLYQSASQAVPGGHQANRSLWSNTEYDKIVDQIYVTPMDDQKKLLDLFRQAMTIWLPELPDIQITEWYHRIPMNTNFWTGWPTKDNAYTNGAFWHLTFQLILNNLKPAQ